MLKQFAIYLFLLCVIGCQTPRAITSQNTVNMPQTICWSNDIEPATILWLAEAWDRFDYPVIFVCHGGYEIIKNGNKQTVEWWCYPDVPRQPMPVQKVANMLANLHPNRNIVLIVCNEFGFTVSTKRVAYAKQTVWVIPDRYKHSHETIRNFDSTGSIWEFVKN